jgi:predicted porin
MTMTAQKTAMALATGLLLASSAIAQTAPTVTLYGRIDLGLESANDGALTRTMLQNYASRIGFKGERGFSGDLAGVFQVETGVAPDDTSQSKAFANRNSFVGLKSKSMGTFLVGTYDSPLKSLDAGGYAGTLYGEGEAMEVIIHGKGTATVGKTTFGDVHTRAKNNIVYISPKFSDVVVKGSYSLADDAQTAILNQPLYAASLEWNNGTYNAGIATQTQEVSSNFFGMTATKFTLGAKMDTLSGAIVVSALDNQAPIASNVRKTTNTLFVVNYGVGAMTYKFNYGTSSESKSSGADDLTMIGLEAAYALDKQTIIYGNYAQITNNTKGLGELVGSDSKVKAAAAGNDPTAITIGIRYNF